MSYGPALARLLHLPHHLERGRRDEADADPVLGQHGEGTLGIELGEAVGQNRRAVEPRREQRVIEARDPGPLGRRPHDLVAARPVAQPLLDRRHRAQHHAMGMQRTLGLAGRARGVDQQGRVLGVRVERREAVRRRAQQRVPVEEVGAVLAGADHDDRRQVRQPLAHRQDLRQLRDVGDDRRGLGIVHAVLDRFLAEQREQRQHDRTHAVAGEMADRELGALAQEHRDPLAFGDAAGGEGVGEAGAGGEELAERPVAHAAVGILLDHRQRAGLVPLAHRAADVEPFGHVPAEPAHRVVVGQAARDHRVITLPASSSARVGTQIEAAGVSITLRAKSGVSRAL